MQRSRRRKWLVSNV